ncbi:MAG: UDP-N-acetylmuramoyl-tripeptide--D-alanyl-D-alanine ligase [Bifidobacteriaceae bacterium]|nr:UDP-N-acetylmuramoyl-tripeptide--D-alanyl-D-alanine ligase [Bifidobacteriaceae bacterium]
MMDMTIAEVAQAVDGAVACADEDRVTEDGADDAGVSGRVITSVCTDSRQVVPGSLFVAIRGERVDGHDFVGTAAAAGAVAALVDHEVDADVPQIVVQDTVAALGAVAKATIELRRSYAVAQDDDAGDAGDSTADSEAADAQDSDSDAKRPALAGAFDPAAPHPFTVIGITGSVGKTTTKDLLAAMLRTQGETVAPVGSFNNEIGLPLTATRVGASTRYMVAEMGASAMGEITYLTSLVPPDVAVVLKVGVAHLGGFGSVENIRRAKAEIVQALAPSGVAILNADDPRVATMADMTPATTIRWFGVDEANNTCDVRAQAIDVDDTDRPSFDLVAQGRTQRVTLALRGRHNVMNALAATCAALTVGVPLDAIVHVLETQGAASPHRMAVSTVEPPAAPVAFTLIDDSFNANPDSMKAGLDGLAAWHAGERRDRPFRIAVLGSMLELGDDDDAKHRDIGAYCSRLGLDALVAVGSGTDANLDRLAGDLAGGAKDADTHERMDVAFVHSTDQAADEVARLTAAHPGAVVLLKGSHASGLQALAAKWAPAQAAA